METEPDVFSFHHDIAREAIEAAARPRAAPPPRGRARRPAGDGQPRPPGPGPPRPGRRPLRRHGGRGPRGGPASPCAWGSTYQARHLAEIGLTEAEDDPELLAVAAEASWLTGLLDDAAAYGDRWLRLARERDDVSQEAAALGVRIRIAREAGALADMAALTDELVGVHRPACPTTSSGPGPWPRSPSRTCCATRSRRPTSGPTRPGAGRGPRPGRREAGGHGREGLGADARPRRHGRGPRAAGGGGRRGRADRRVRAGRPGAQQPDLARPAVERHRGGAPPDRPHAPGRRGRRLRDAGPGGRAGGAGPAGVGGGRPRRRDRPPRRG